MPENKTQTEFIFLPRPRSSRLILSHLVILNKDVLPELRLTFTALRCYIEWNGTKRSTYSE